jgi:hypothetical protein
MESQQMMELLLAKIRAGQEQAAANTKAMRENMKADLENLQVTMKTNQDVLIKTVKVEMRAMLDACHKGMMACLGKTKADTEKPEPDPGMMQSAEEHQEFTKEDTAVKPVKGRKRRHRGRKPAAGRRGEPKEPTRGDCGSGKKLAVAWKKITHRATVAWRKRNVLKKIVTQGNCGPQSTLTAARIMMTRHARVALRRENFVRKDCTRAKDERVTNPESRAAQEEFTDAP